MSVDAVIERQEDEPQAPHFEVQIPWLSAALQPPPASTAEVDALRMDSLARPLSAHDAGRLMLIDRFLANMATVPRSLQLTAQLNVGDMMGLLKYERQALCNGASAVVRNVANRDVVGARTDEPGLASDRKALLHELVLGYDAAQIALDENLQRTRARVDALLGAVVPALTPCDHRASLCAGTA